MENERIVFYSSKTQFDRDTFRELNKIAYRRNNIVVSIGLVFIALLCGFAFYVKALSLVLCLVLFFISSFLCVIKFKLKKHVENQHTKLRLEYKKDMVEQVIEFSDKIYVTSNGEIERSYDYSLVEKLYETSDAYFLVFPGNAILTVSKSNFKSNIQSEFRHFIYEKCYSVKEPIFKKLKNNEKTYNRLVAVSFLLSIIVLMLYFFQITPENWRELGRNPQFSSSQQSTNSSSDASK